MNVKMKNYRKVDVNKNRELIMALSLINVMKTIVIDSVNSPRVKIIQLTVNFN